MNTQTTTPVPLEDIDYPDSDGKPMAENTLQFLWIVYLKENFDYLFCDRPDVFVAGDLLWYPVKGDRLLCTAPDTLIAFGPPKGHRGSYMQWREGHVAPQVVWEVLSPGNTPGEMRDKLEYYERYGVEEYYEYDPDRGELRGWLRKDDRLRPIAQMHGWISPRTGVRMDLEGDDLVMVGSNGKRFMHSDEVRVIGEEQHNAREEAEAQGAEERSRREAAEARVTEERSRREAAEARVTEERSRREAAQIRADQERREKQAAAARAERLAAQLRALGIDPEA